MSQLFDDFQNTLCSPSPDYHAFYRALKTRQKDLAELDLVRSHGLLRLSLALQEWIEAEKGSIDTIVLMRQVMRHYHRRLILPSLLWKQLSNGENIAGLRVVNTMDQAMIEVVADEWQPSWLSNTKQIDLLQRRRKNEDIVGDGLLAAMTKGAFSYY